jgi:hypothetical protein
MATTVTSSLNSQTIGAASVDVFTPTNVSSVLNSAVPSDIATSLAAQFRNCEVSTATAIAIVPRIPAGGVASTITAGSIVTSARSTLQTSPSSTLRDPQSSSTTHSVPSVTTTAPARTLPNNAIAGVATSVTVAAVLIILAVVYSVRRRQQQLSRDSQYSQHGLRERASHGGSVYPEVAWLYDPPRSGDIPLTEHET